VKFAAVHERTTWSASARRLTMAAVGLAVLCAAGLASAQDQPHSRGQGGGQGRAHGGPQWRGGGPPPPGPRGYGAPGYDPRQHNGYWVGPRWHYGPPPAPTLRAPGYRPGFAPWRPGGFLPPQYPVFIIDEYWRFHLRRPPYGFHWVQAGDEFLLVSISTGQIFDVVIGY
jgi:Ni/Co efflux regulator RcnB